jgi:hypothetical protein
MKSKRKQDWKIFEETVAQIEKVLSPKGAVVKSPDRITDLVTNQRREVDASIRYFDKTTPVLITVECRDRNKVQDDMWIEQLVTKQRKIGAMKTIAVSSKGFTKPAQITAQEFGIELRTCEKVKDEQILVMLDGLSFSAISTFRHIDELHLQVENKNKPSGLVKPHMDAEMDKYQHDTVIAYTSADDEEVKLKDLLDLMDESTVSEEDKARKVKGDTLILNIEMEPGNWYYPVDELRYGIRKIQLKLRFEINTHTIPVISVSNYNKGKTTVAQMVKASLGLDNETSVHISLVR